VANATPITIPTAVSDQVAPQQELPEPTHRRSPPVTDSQGCSRNHQSMQQHPATPRDRDRSLRRVRRLTFGAAVGSLAAVLGLATVAAATNPGETSSQSSDGTASSQPATGTGSTATQTPTPTQTPAATPSQSTGDSGLQQAPSAPSAGTSGGASATSGGS
jgi:hypothetical protein